MKAAGAFISAHPVAFIIGGASLIALYLTHRYWDRVSSVFSKIGKGIKSACRAIGDFFSSMWSKIMSWFRGPPDDLSALSDSEVKYAVCSISKNVEGYQLAIM